MRKKRSWITAVLAFAMLAASFAISPKSAFACSCAMPASVAEELGRSDAVFDGTVIAGHKPRKWFTESSADPVTWTFEAHEIWKGKVAPTVTVTSAQSGASCGVEFQEGKRYIVYARGTGDSLDVSLCSRTALQSAASSDLADLGDGSIPPLPTENEGDAANPLTRISIFIGLAIAIIAAVYASIRIKSHSRNKSG
ncbi:hypothetical protein RB620_19490 [Paenibacillus sp. LHD-117]|uniref:hypothetical protein n=1 Tax=Paenibacillus sp. LHD-117 TaxID=3071412 RepID=UPI0027E15524|nr:hypothetical protein [Paenibacillus sp. LHD-117]MDQ6421614.1 hypothetical protein [Paenibacillus sp. LHD-117]